MIDRSDTTSRSLRSRLVSLFLRYKLKPRLCSEDFDPVRFRGWLDRQLPKQKLSAGVTVQEVAPPDIGVKGEWHTPADSKPESCVLYLHGGGYLFGSPRSYRGFTTRLATLCKSRIFSLDYRMAPEQVFPAAVEDAVAAYDWLLQQQIKPSQIVLAGDSAGAGLALALLHALKERGQPLPAGLIAMSPYADLLTRSVSLEENSQSCVMFTAECIRAAAAIYLGGADGASPLASPVYGDFTGLPPMLIYVSDNEALRDDALRVADAADKAGVAVRLSVWRGQAHVWPIFYPFLPEADACLVEMAEFANSCTS